ncbi:MAG: aminotransferase class I/II-fold pyridoxal phosphate-dependent enzyme, partial [Candidatus Cloacimonetes bacterium]|nr:aminotransferase class I/II-fold pyridoxal phosphate-dependent enzyme [Candidatus Cloacimonadota bacterium]
MGFNTRAIHAGQEPDPQTGSVTTPIIQTSTFAQTGIGQHKGWDYTRAGNPTRDAAEANLAALENASHGHLFSSGMAAIHALTVLLKTGDHIVCTRDVYGGTWRLITQILEPWGLKADFVESHTVANVEKAIRPETKLLFIETPTNPLLTVTDIAAMAQLARRHKLILVVDNT